MTASDSHDHEPEWASWSNEQLLNLPMNQLGVTLDGAFLSAQIQQLYAELDARQLLFRPHCWLSNEWFTPDGVPGIAVPFYLAHPRLATPASSARRWADHLRATRASFSRAPRSAKNVRTDDAAVRGPESASFLGDIAGQLNEPPLIGHLLAA